jgi:hypothetical protein
MYCCEAAEGVRPVAGVVGCVPPVPVERGEGLGVDRLARGVRPLLRLVRGVGLPVCGPDPPVLGCLVLLVRGAGEAKLGTSGV